MYLKYIILLFLLINHFVGHSQQWRPFNSNSIYEHLNQLKNATTIMYLAAHPDDENTRLLSYLVHHENLETIYFSITRGDGGQNLIGNEQGSALGLIRNYELLAARQIDGAKQSFSSFVDFGYTKSEVETFNFWNKQKLVDEVKRAIQIYRPEVIICRFPTTGEGGHGQHTASAIVAVTAFNQLKEESKYNKNIFVPIRVVFNAFKFGNRSTIKDDQIKLITNHYNPLLGESYGEMAGTSRSIHKSQGVGTPQTIGRNYEYFELMAGEEMIQSPLEGISVDWLKYNLPEANQLLSEIIEDYNFLNPGNSLNHLIKLYDLINNSEIPNYRKKWFIDRLKPLILSCAGVMIETITDKEFVTKGEVISISNRLIARPPKDVSLRILKITHDNEILPIKVSKLPIDTAWESNNKIIVNQSSEIDQPYWLKEKADNNSEFKYRYYVDEKDFSKPESVPKLQVTYTLLIDTLNIEIDVPVSYKYLDPLKGDVVQQVHITPLVSITPNDDIAYIDPLKKIFSTGIRVYSNQNIDTAHFFATQQLGVVTYHSTESSGLNKNSNKQNEKIQISKMTLNDIEKGHFKIIQQEFSNVQEGDIYYSVVAQKDTFDKTMKIIQYDHIPKLVYYETAKTKIVYKDFQIPQGKFGYIVGAGDHVFDHLKMMGLDITLIPAELISDKAFLNQFDAIILGVRAYNTNQELALRNDQLLKYVHQGGKLIVQYNTSNNLLLNEFAPYPLTIGRDRVTMENSPITISNPQDRLLNYPNEINSLDFDGWVQERGLYFPKEIGDKYKTLFIMQDQLENEKPLHHALIYAKYGKGTYIYTGLSFFRQIPAGHKGAIKLFLNLLS